MSYETFSISIQDDLHLPENEWPKLDENTLIESAVVEAIRNIQISREMAITTALGAISTACQGLFQIQMPTGNIVNPNLMLLTIAESGERKTSTEKVFFNSLKKRQKELYEEQASDTSTQHQHEIWKEKTKALKTELRKRMREDKPTDDIENKLEKQLKEEPSTATYDKFLYSDTTPQALVLGMSQSSRNACLLSSEANGIFNGQAFRDLHLLNSLWDGDDIAVDRTSQPSFYLTDARLTMSLMVQMQSLQRFLTKRGEEARGLGFLARFLVTKAPQMKGSRDLTKAQNDTTHSDAFNKRTAKLLTASLEQKNSKEKVVLTFSSTAQDEWFVYAQAIEEAQKEDAVYEYYSDHASKLMDNITRVAGLIHFFEPETEQGIIESHTLKFAYQLCMRYSKHFLHYIADDPEVIKNANKLITNLYAMDQPHRAIDNKSSYTHAMLSPKPCEIQDANGNRYRKGCYIEFTASDLINYGTVRNKSQFNRVMILLQKMDYIQRDPNKRAASYKFSDIPFSLLYSPSGDSFERIKLKNGNEYSIRTLPMFEDYELLENHQTGSKVDTNSAARAAVGYAAQSSNKSVYIRCPKEQGL